MQQMRKTSVRLILCFAALAFVPPRAHAGNDSLSAVFYLRQGLKQLDKHNFDEALNSFTRAADAGMSKDSVCYFYAEAYAAKGAFDTALVFNFGVKAAGNPGLALLALKQRAAIYLVLKWKKDADQILDSLSNLPRYSRRPYLPDAGFRIGADYTERRELDQVSFPFDGPLEAQYYNGPGYDGYGYARWEIPIGRRFLIKPGLEGLVTSKYYQTMTSRDSVNRALGGFVSFEHAPSGLSLDYGLRRLIDYAGEYTTQNSVSISRSKTKAGWTTVVLGGYDLETGAGFAKVNQRFWAVGHADQTTVRQKGWTFQLMASYFDAAPIRQLYDTSVMLYPDSVNVMYVNDVHSSHVIHYQNASSTDTVPRSFLGYVLNSADNVAVLDYRTYSQRQISVEPSAQYTARLPLAFRASLSCGTSLTYFTEPYSWLTTADPGGAYAFAGRPIIVFNEKDQNYYWYLQPIQQNPATFTEVFGSTPVDKQAYRTDLTVELLLNIAHPIGILGTLALRVEASKNYSTLRKLKLFSWEIFSQDAPFAIPDRSWSAGITWTYDFRAN